jgi:BirA family transcriptional regulator, biotin operon repressor / biotin---[acetyl-CoA-carboxylase] ligase
VELTGDLSAAELEAALPGRAVRSYPALVSTDAEARAWARAGADDGAVVVAGYQASPRGRGGLEWSVGAESLAFSLVLRPRLPAEREGWLYVVTACAVADVVGRDASIEWPDEVWSDGARAGAAGIHVELGPEGTEWASVTVLLCDAPPPRAPLVGRVVDAIEARYRAPNVPVLAEYLRRCDTIGRRVTARLIPLGPGGAKVTGKALRVLADGALVLETDEGTRIAVRPQNLGVLERA